MHPGYELLLSAFPVPDPQGICNGVVSVSVVGDILYVVGDRKWSTLWSGHFACNLLQNFGNQDRSYWYLILVDQMFIRPFLVSSPGFIESESAVQPSVDKQQACYSCLTIQIKRCVDSGKRMQMTIRAGAVGHVDLAQGQSVNPVLAVQSYRG